MTANSELSRAYEYTTTEQRLNSCLERHVCLKNDVDDSGVVGKGVWKVASGSLDDFQPAPGDVASATFLL